MVWGVITFDESRHALLTSDYPLVISNGIKKPDGHLALALNPKQLFVACYRRELFDHITSQADIETVSNYNKCIVERARRFVGAHDTNQRRFIENRFGAKPIDFLEQVLDRAELEGIETFAPALDV